MSTKSPSRPLVVDLDGTLIKTDMLFESALSRIIRDPRSLLSFAKYLLKGKSHLKSYLSQDYDFDPSVLPYSDEVIQEIITAREKGRQTVLASASNQLIVDKIGSQLGLFDLLLGSTQTHNLSGLNKAAVLDELFGQGNYIYAGNSNADVAVWEKSAQAIVVSKSKWLVRKVRKVNHQVKVIAPSGPSPFKTWTRQLRIHQWVKNTLLFVPALAAFKFLDASIAQPLALAFLAFSFVASSIYIINDAVDLENDRLHPTKRFRPLAAGLINLPAAAMASGALLSLGLLIGWLVGLEFTIVLIAYLITTFLYSFWLKRTALVDCLVLAGLYTLRILAGSVALHIPLSFWLLAFSVFFFLSLAWVKRYAELEVALKSGKPKAVGRGYSVGDLPILLALGSSSGFLAVLIFALYLDSEAIRSQYVIPQIGWLAIPVLLYIVGRMWLKAHRGEMDEDPIIFVIKDRPSLVAAGLIAIALVVAHVGLGKWN